MSAPTVEQAAAVISARISPWELVGDPLYQFQTDEWIVVQMLKPFGPLIRVAFKLRSTDVQTFFPDYVPGSPS